MLIFYLKFSNISIHTHNTISHLSNYIIQSESKNRIHIATVPVCTELAFCTYNVTNHVMITVIIHCGIAGVGLSHILTLQSVTDYL